MVADSLERSKGARPLERSTLLPRADWLRCAGCGATFGTRGGLRSHRRYGRCPGLRLPAGTDLGGSSLPGDLGLESDPLDDPNLRGDALRRAVTRRLRYLAGPPEEP